MDIRDTLKERGDRYGAFEDHARLCQGLKDVMKDGRSWNRCSHSQKQALEVIADKIARMLNGDPDYDDNWIDIIGYSQLVLNELKEHAGQTKINFGCGQIDPRSCKGIYAPIEPSAARMEMEKELRDSRLEPQTDALRYGTVRRDTNDPLATDKIWDGNKWVDYNSLAGQAIKANLK